MVTPELIAYVKKKKGEQLPDDSILAQLTGVGWNTDDVKQAMLFVANPDLPLPPQSTTQTPTPSGGNKSNRASYQNLWDAFEHILMFISMYVMAVALALLLNHFVDEWVPKVDTYRDYYSYSSSSYSDDRVIGYMAAIIVSAPLFIFLFLRITKKTLAHPEVRLLVARKLLIYLTLIGTFIIMLCWVIAFVYQMLKGNITFNFVLHILVTVSIAGMIFAYYLNQVKEDRKFNE